MSEPIGPKEPIDPGAVALDVDSTIARHIDRNKLTQYFELLMAENAKVNLVSRETARSDFDRMVAESLVPLDFLTDSFGSYLDIGSGGGIPAIPLLLSGRIAGPAWLVERTQKKAAALRRILAALNLQAEVFARTYEEVALTQHFDLITLRYVKLTPQLLQRIAPAMNPTGQFVYYSKVEFEPAQLSIHTHSYSVAAEDFVKSVTVFHRKS